MRCCQPENRIEASVEPVTLPLSHPLAGVHGAENRLMVEFIHGEPLIISGTGAGRWPTTEAVLADLLDIRREMKPLDISEEFAELEACVA